MEVDQTSSPQKEKRLSVHFDGRTKFARDLRDARKRLIDERGGLAALGAVQIDAINAFALLSLERERMADARRAGQPIDLDQYGQLADRCDRLARRMGDPVKKPTTPSIRDRYPARRP